MAEAPLPSVLHDLSAAQAAHLLRQRQLSSVDLVQAHLERATRLDERIRAWETLDGERAIEAARKADALLSRGASAPLLGVPFGVKDVIDTAGLRTAGGFQPFDQRVPVRDATVVGRLKKAGGVLLGKLVTTQMAFVDPPRTRNPWAADRTPGGSSSGSGAAVAARLVPLALGTQTVGSVLRPAAYNGVVGFKPSYGLVSRQGVLPLAWSLDHVGVLARSVEDCRIYLDVASQRAAPVPVAPTHPRPPHLGLLLDGLERASPRVRAHILAVAERFESAGARVSEVRLSQPLDLLLAVLHLVLQTEAAAVHWHLLEQYPGAYQPRLRTFVEVGRLVPGPVYLHARRLRHRIRDDLEHLASSVDALLLPTVADLPPAIDTTGDPGLQAPFSLVGQPSISLPSGLSPDGLPLAIQLAARRGQDRSLLAVAAWCEQILGPMPAPPESSTKAASSG